MGLRLRAQIMTLFVVLIGLSMAVIAYFNIGVFRLSFLADEEQRLRHLGLQAGERILQHVLPIYLNSKGAGDPSRPGPEDFDESKIPGLRYYELWDVKGAVLYRSGQTGPPLPLKEELVRRMATQPLPTHLFLIHKPGFAGPLNLPYSDTLPLFRSADERDVITYEHLFPIFELVDDSGSSSLSQLPPARLRAVLHLSFDVQSSSRRLHLVTAGNVLLALTFLLTSLMSIHLWTQHAVQRPLEGLVESMRQFDSEIKDVELASSNELINLSQTLHHLALERLKYQRELEQLNRELEAQVEEKTREMKEFFSLVTHDLRIPLAAIQGYTDLLKRKPEQLSERHLTYVSRISTANGHALELVRNLLEAMKIEFGTLQPVMETFSLDLLAEEVSGELNVDETLPPVVLEPAADNEGEVNVEADRTRIKRVLTNLLSNAQKHADGTPNVVLRWRKVPRRGVRIEVVDQGPGIPVGDRQRLFEKFTRAPGSMGNTSGLGLGLYIVGRILESHQQEIAVLGEVGKGTTFEFHLPVPSGQVHPA